MRVLVVATAYPREKGDIITPWLVRMVKELKKRSIEVEVFTSSYKGLKSHYHEGVFVHRFRYLPAPFETLTHDKTAIDRVKENPIFIIHSLSYLIFGMIGIFRLVKKRRYDGIHLHWPIPHILFGIAARFARRVRLIASFHGVEIRWLKRDLKPLLPLFVALLKKADVITANSNHTREELLPYLDARVIPFGVGFQKEVAVGEGDYILFVGRLVERKGVEYLIRAFAQIKDEIGEDLYIVGSGPLMGRLKGLSEELDLRERVRFFGLISDEELTRLLAGCRVFSLPAVVDRKGDTEGLGVVLIEALAYKRPVVASRVGGITDIVIDNKTGVLVEPGDVDELARALLRLVKDEGLRRRLGKEGADYVRDRFSWSRVTDLLIKAYRGEDHRSDPLRHSGAD
ncbi:hypothetical protein DRP53_02420 [candidate division WOR-3 bacterium]|uniref:Glycosyltransferase family 1 protein n=1 Tax=candidate division WOR-3 bacterium TaxID=2052148 RepID=A0A660SMI1_UNCW3|nr:MAG: hypothetical protein DRP53_02420 [candidate division WOR-3 bacterium]